MSARFKQELYLGDSINVRGRRLRALSFKDWVHLEMCQDPSPLQEKGDAWRRWVQTTGGGYSPLPLPMKKIRTRASWQPKAHRNHAVTAPEGISSQLSNRMRRCASLEGGTSKE